MKPILFSQKKPFIKVWIHFVWATKDREAVFGEMVRPVLFQHINEGHRGNCPASCPIKNLLDRE